MKGKGVKKMINNFIKRYYYCTFKKVNELFKSTTTRQRCAFLLIIKDQNERN
tara:strand:- start:227 stop:382 length:156 start_codon:yes stop_codon:yes gene_type:complete